MIEYFERQVRFKDFEVWDVQIGGQSYMLAIADEFRAATLEDFEMPDLIYEEDDHRANYVSTTYFSEKPMKDEHREPLGEFARMLTNHLALAHCEVITKFYQENREKAIEHLMSTKYGYTKTDIPLVKLRHLNQD